MQTFVATISILFYGALWKFINKIVLIIGILEYLFFFLSYTLTCIMNPGIITPDYYLENYKVDKMNIKNYRICRKCNAIMDIDKGVEHCIDCDICIIGNDHHCPWSSKCVGKNNINMFRVFLCSVFIHIGYLCLASMITAITYTQNNQTNQTKKN